MMRPVIAQLPHRWSGRQGMSYRIDRASRLLACKWEPGRLAVDDGHPSDLLEIVEGALRPCQAELGRRWQSAVARVVDHCAGELFALARSPQWRVVSLTPVEWSGAVQVLVRSSRCAAPETVAIEELAAMVGLSPRESEVLAALMEGEVPKTIARRLGTQLTTVRAQVRSLLGKTGLASTRDLIRFVAGLPPVVPAEGRWVELVEPTVPTPLWPCGPSGRVHPVQRETAGLPAAASPGMPSRSAAI